MAHAHADPGFQAASPAPAHSSFAAPGARDAIWLGLLAVCCSVLAFIFFFRHGDVLLYGDATAHIHIARRVLDSRTPGISQLGTVWLPLPHLLILPFILSHKLWQTGIGGSIPSMLAYVAGVLGIFRLVRGSTMPSADAMRGSPAARLAAWCAALAYALNPNLLYLQSTAMTEPLYLALFIWATVFFTDFVQATQATGTTAQERRSRALFRCGLLLAAAMLTRYDGWFAAGGFAVAAFLVVWRWTGGRTALWRSPLRPAFTRFLLIIAAAPLLWFVYNAFYWGNPLEFATGPYSAHAIEARSSRAGGWHHPGWHAPRVATIQFLKTAKLNMAGGPSQPETPSQPGRRLRWENVWPPLAFLGSLLVLVTMRSAWPWLLLWLPVPFYTLSVGWGDVPIFLPVWWPFSYYNVRYGIQLLPAFSVFGAAFIYAVSLRFRSRFMLPATVALFAVLMGASYAVAGGATPICLREARANSADRIPFDRKLAAELNKLPPDASLTIYAAYHAAALQFAGFPLRHTINESDDKLWRAALAAPGRLTDFVVAFDTPDDPVARAVNRHGEDLQVVSLIQSPNEPRATIYRRLTR